MGKVILMGGSPTAGKSYTARKISEELKLPWVSTDTIRGQMRRIVKREDYPALFCHADATVEMGVEFLNENSAKKIVERINTESEEVWGGVRAFIEADYVWGSFIVEGVAILPHLVADFVKKNKDVKVVFLIDEDVERVRKTIFTRGLWDDAKKYPDDVKEKEVEWVLAFNEFIKKEAKRFGFSVVSVGDRKDCVGEIKKVIG